MEKAANDFCKILATYINTKDGHSLSQILSMNNLIQTEPIQDLVFETNVPNKSQLKQFNSSWGPFVEVFFEFIRRVNGPKIEAFTSCNELLKALNRCAEKEDSWILESMKMVSKELKSLALLADIEDQGLENAELNLEIASRTINKSFTVCLNDREPIETINKSQAVFYFSSFLFSIYFKINKLDLAKSLQKALKFKENTLPSIKSVPQSHSVTYLYYNGCLYCNEGNLEMSYTNLSEALSMVHKDSIQQQQMILILLIPIVFYHTGIFPSKYLFGKYPKIRKLYGSIFSAIKMGNLMKFDYQMKKMEIFLLKRNLYLIFRKIRLLVVRRLFRRAFLIASTLPQIENIYQFPLVVFTKALDVSLNSPVSKHHKHVVTNDETETFLANLIFHGFIKGYISHGNGVVVVSKKDPFPSNVSVK